MRKNVRLHVASALVSLAIFAAPAAASTPASADDGPETDAIAAATLIEDAAAWDSRAVAFVGEAIGEPMARGDHAWLQLNDDPYQDRSTIEAARPRHGYNSGLAVWAPARLARRVRMFGGYGHRGEIVRVVGTFHAACREHGGDMDIHAASLRVVEDGYAVVHPFPRRRLGLGLALLALALALDFTRRRAAPKRTDPGGVQRS